MNIQQLKYALEISRQGSFSRASQSLFLSQPALSNAIKNLETELGYSIFIRDRKSCHPTDEGRSFLKSAQAIIQEWENIQKLNHTPAAEKTHILKVSSDRAAFVCKAFLEFHKEDLHDKKYSLHLYEGDSSQVVNDILTKACDIGILVVLASDNSGWMNELKKKEAFPPLPVPHKLLHYPEERAPPPQTERSPAKRPLSISRIPHLLPGQAAG